MQIGLFGGAFDPPHIGHQAIVTALLEHQFVDQVWMVPVGQHAFGKLLTPANERLEMLQRALTTAQPIPVITSQDPQALADQGHSVAISTYELDNNQLSITFNTLEYFAMTYPEHTWSWVIGSDNVAGFSRWHHYQALLERYPVYVYPRHGYPLTTLLPGMIGLHHMAEVKVSSTQVRLALAEGKTITQLVAPAVAQYIKQRGLYATSVE